MTDIKEYITVSGGIGSAYCANLVLTNLSLNAELIFTDTKWEDQDLYRFLYELEKFWNKKIIRLSDGRNPEKLFFDKRMLGSNRVPLCSRVLKAETMQNYLKKIEGRKIVYFGIDADEAHRAEKIKAVYDKLGIETRFPLIDKKIMMPFDKERIQNEIENDWGIKVPRMYREGFSHNNCSGGCVRQGKNSYD